MYGFLITVLLFIENVCSTLWSNGVVHYAINKKDYDLHSQDEITSTFAQLQKEICVKFFDTPLNYSAGGQHKILYISNPEKTRACPPHVYDYSRAVIDMPIGYKCINQKNIARIIVDMLKASIGPTVSHINSYDLVKRFNEKDEDPNRKSLLSPADRNYINGYYHFECDKLSQRDAISARRAAADATDSLGLSRENLKYYGDKIWKWGIISYHIEEKLRDTPEAAAVLRAIRTIEESTCVQFQKEWHLNDIKFYNVLNLGSDGADRPNLGFVQGVQNVSLSAMANGAPGHKAHVLNMLMRHIGVPMMSNRIDRDNYITINWNNVEQGKQHYLEREPKAAYMLHIPYDYRSVTHAPANYLCNRCDAGSYTVEPVQDHLWERLMTMGQSTKLSEFDIQIVNILYGKQCMERQSWGSAGRL